MNITETEVAAFLADQARYLKYATGAAYALVYTRTRADDHGAPEIEWSCLVDGGQMNTHPTLEEAYQAAVSAMAPASLALAKRQAAAALIAEAEKLETT